MEDRTEAGLHGKTEECKEIRRRTVEARRRQIFIFDKGRKEPNRNRT